MTQRKESKEQNSPTSQKKSKPKYDFKSEDRDQIVLTVIQHEEEMRHANSHLGTDPVSSVSKNYTYWSQREDTGYEYWSSLNPPRKNDKISFVVCPSWGIIFPPYNAARISSLLRENGYEVTVYDTNIESYHYLKDKLLITSLVKMQGKETPLEVTILLLVVKQDMQIALEVVISL